MVYVLQKFWHYVLGGHFKMYTDHLTLKYLVNKPVLGGNICRWLLLFKEFDFEVIVKPGWLNVGPDHLSRIESGEEPTSMEDNLPDTQLFVVTLRDDQNKEFNAIIHFLSTWYPSKGFTIVQKKHLVVRATGFTLIVGHLHKMGTDEILWHCVFDHEWQWVIKEAHASVAGRHYTGKETVHKILQPSLWWPTIHMDTKIFCQQCDMC